MPHPLDVTLKCSDSRMCPCFPIATSRFGCIVVYATRLTHNVYIDAAAVESSSGSKSASRVR